MRKNILNLKHWIIITVSIAILLLSYLIYDMNKTSNTMAQTLIGQSKELMTTQLDQFFQGVTETLSMSEKHMDLYHQDTYNHGFINTYFEPILKIVPQIKYATIASSSGRLFSVYYQHDSLLNTEIFPEKGQMYEEITLWQHDALSRRWKQQSILSKKEHRDFRELSYFQGALQDPDDIFWSYPFHYATGEVGLTATTVLQTDDSADDYIVGYGLTMRNIARYTNQLKPSPMGKVFLLSAIKEEPERFASSLYLDDTTIFINPIENPDSAFAKVMHQAFHYWNDEWQNAAEAFHFEFEKEVWYSAFSKYYLSEENFLIIATLIPRDDVMKDMEKTKRIIIGSFIFLILLTGILIYAFGLIEKANDSLVDKNAQIVEQNILIERKRKNIYDSINYAQRLQQALFPPPKRMHTVLPEHFLLYMPKDIVAGDFYWMETMGEHVIFAAADCTGHGVPGALVSFVCINALNQATHNYGLTDPGAILDKTRELVIGVFEKADSEVKDGMDIAMCTVSGNTLKFAGANNPLYLIREKELIEIKADKQPIGNHIRKQPFTTHTLDLVEGDCIYIFSDGFVDQFGGPDNKKFKSKQFKALLLELQDSPMEEQLEILRNTLIDWSGDEEQVDDICVIGYKHSGRVN